MRWFFLFVSPVLLCTPLFVGAEGASGQCDSEYKSCISRKQSGCEQRWQGCMSKCNVGGGAVGSCNKDPECQLHCTESATSQGGRISCCEGGPKHQNSCPNKVDGNCEPKKTDGGEGKMPELPKPPPGGGGKPSQGVCEEGASTTPDGKPCPGKESCGAGVTETPGGQPCPPQAGGLGSYFNNIFSPDKGSMTENVQSTLSSAADKLSSFLFGTDSSTDQVSAAGAQTSANTNNPVVPIGGTQLAPQVVQATPIGSGSQNTGAPSAPVTGFGSQNTAPTEQSGLMRAIGETLSGIGITLKNLLSSWAF